MSEPVEDPTAACKCEYCKVPIAPAKMKRHAHICNVKRQIKEVESLPFYKCDTNILNSSYSDVPIDGFTVDEVALREKVLSSYAKYIGEIRQIAQIHSDCGALFQLPSKIDGEDTSSWDEEKKKSYFESSLRHREQEGGIVYHMEQNNILNSIDTFVELGAGKAKLSLAIAQVKPDAQYLIVERSSYKLKAENGLRKHYRARVDLRHVDLFTLLNFYDKNSTKEPVLPMTGKYMKAQKKLTDTKGGKEGGDSLTGNKRHADAPAADGEDDAEDVAGEAASSEPMTVETNPKAASVDSKAHRSGGGYIRKVTSTTAADASSQSVDPETLLCHRSVCVGKHLCGAATDFAIVAMKQLYDDIQQNGNPTTTTAAAGGEDDFVRSTPQLSGFAIATCCHGSCDFNYCTAQDFLVQECGLLPQEWETFRRWAGFFATDKSQRDREVQYREELACEQPGLAAEEVERLARERFDYEGRSRVGRCCKRLIDYGRLQYIKKHTNLKVEMVHYVDASTSPENCLIIGYL